MFIDYVDFASLTVTIVSDDTNDVDSLLYATAITSTFPIPYEGSLVFNFTTVDNIITNEAGWPSDLGFSLANNDFKNIPCTILLNGVLIGKGSTNHPNVRCFIFSSNIENNNNALIQVRGFSSNINPGSNIQVYIPNV
jgi:hypothetical protein